MTTAPMPDDSPAARPGDAVAATDRPAGTDGPVGADDIVVTRSEEHLQVTTERVPVTRVRLRKQIVTEMQTITVPISREELVIDHEPITDGDGTTGSVPDDAQQDLEIILYAERPVVTTETVAVERIRVSTTTVTEDRTITGTVGKEQIELHTDPPEDSKTD